MLFAEIDAAGWVMIITAIGYVISDIAEKRKTAKKVAEVAETLEVKDAKQAAQISDVAVAVAEAKKTGESIHILVNSSMSAQLKIAMIALKRIAALTHGAEDESAAEQAEKLYHEHEQKQGLLDAKDAREGKAK